jgi:hypothetical protein
VTDGLYYDERTIGVIVEVRGDLGERRHAMRIGRGIRLQRRAFITRLGAAF